MSLTASDGGADGWVPRVVPVGSLRRAGIGCGDEEGGDPLHGLRKAQMKIPLVAQLERLYTAGDGVSGERGELRVPVGINGPVNLESAADPLDELGLAFTERRLDRVVKQPEARAAAEDFAEDGETVFLQGDVPRAAIGKNDDGIDLGERGRILGPAIEGHFGADALDGCEAFLEQQDARIMFVLPGPVAGWSGDEQDFFIGGEQGCGSQISEQRKQQGGGQARPE